MTSEKAKKDSKEPKKDQAPCASDPANLSPCSGGGSSSGNDDPKPGATCAEM